MAENPQQVLGANLTDLAKRAPARRGEKSWPAARALAAEFGVEGCNRGISRTTVKAKAAPVQHQR